MFFKDYAYTALAIKYSKYIYDLKAKTYMIQSFLVRSVYSLKKERKRNAVKIISQYILSYSAAKTMQKFMEFVLLLQLRIR